MRFAFAFVLALASSCALADKIDDYIKSEMAKNKVPGMVVGIARNGKLVSKRAYGFSDLDQSVKTTTDDLFELGSITKQFTAFGTMLLVEEGKITLDDPLSKFIPEAPETWKDIKIRNLLYQNSGLQDYAFIEGIGLLDEFDRKKWMDSMTKLPLDFQPGLTWAYSNSNYALLGWVIEKAAGKPYRDFMTERVLKPLGMTHTLFDNTYQIVPRRAHGYLRMGDQVLRAKVGGTMTINSDGSLMSNLEDMAKWDAALRERKLLKSASYDLIWSPGKLNSGRPRFYGMGWNLMAPGGVPYVGHAGASVGYSAGFARYPAKGISVIVLTNVYAINGEGTGKAIAELYDPSLIPPIPAEAADSNPTRTERIRSALIALGAGKPDESLLDAEITGPMKTARAGMAAPNSPFKKIDRLAFAGTVNYSGETWLTYRLQSGDRSFTAYALVTPEDKLAQVILRGDPPKK